MPTHHATHVAPRAVSLIGLQLAAVPHGQAGCCAAPDGDDWDLAVTINPEARVSIVRADRPLGTWIPGVDRDLVLAVRNEGFVTGPLQVWAESEGDAFEADLDGGLLSGEHQQRFRLRTRLTAAEAVPVVLQARAVSPNGDVGGRDRVRVVARPTLGQG